MSRPFSARQRRENGVFLEGLRRTGNVRLSAREAGVKYATMQHRRAGHPDFASDWDVALVDAHARFRASGGKGPPAMPRGSGTALRTAGGEPVVVRTKGGKLQVRPAHRGKLTRTCEQLFLRALAASANIRLSAAAAGASPAAFYRRRKRSEAFEREFRLALETGYERLEMAALAAAAPESHADDAWRSNELPELPPMTANQALQLLHLHHRSVRLGVEARYLLRRRGESDSVHGARLNAIRRADEALSAERERLRAAIDTEAEEGAAPALPPLPDLASVTGWSRASGRPAHHPGVALFGGWRIADMEEARRRGGDSAGRRLGGRGRGLSGGGGAPASSPARRGGGGSNRWADRR